MYVCFPQQELKMCLLEPDRQHFCFTTPLLVMGRLAVAFLELKTFN